jgi:hypothetical protein
LLPSLLSAAVFQVPSGSYPTIQAAYNAAQSGDTIEFQVSQTNLYLVPPALLNNSSKQVLFRPASGTAIMTANTPPANDTFAGRTVLSGSSVSISAENYAASTSPDLTPAGCGVPACYEGFGRGVWFEWTAPSNGLVIVSTYGSDFATELYVFKGNPADCLSLQTEIVWDDRSNEAGFNAQAGVPYQILVGGRDRAYGRISLTITVFAPPPNDNFAAAHLVMGTLAQVEGTTISSTFETPLEPDHAGAAAHSSVWFTWTAPSGDAIAARPMRISTAGSDFNTVLAVYQGASVGQLAPRASNDDCCPFTYESEVTFTPVPGSTYYIAVDGSANSSRARDRAGNYLLRLDYSVVDLAMQSLSRATNSSNGEVAFSALLTVRDWGLAPTGPLRVRLTARNGTDFVGIHRAPAASESNLGTFAGFASAGLSSGESRSLVVNGVCPGPLVEAGVNKPWGVFAVLEELFAGQWITIDRTFLLYGVDSLDQFQARTSGIGRLCRPLSYGLSRPVPPSLAPNEVNQIQGSGVRLSGYVTDRSTNAFTLIAQLDTGAEAVVPNATWSGPGWVALDSNGILRVGDVSRTTNFTVTGRYNLGGVTTTRTDTVPVYKRPRLTLQPTPTRNTFQLVIQSDFIAPYALEYKNNVTNLTWLTHGLGTLQPYPVTNDLVGTNLNRRFYRLNVQPR